MPYRRSTTALTVGDHFCGHHRRQETGSAVAGETHGAGKTRHETIFGNRTNGEKATAKTGDARTPRPHYESQTEQHRKFPSNGTAVCVRTARVDERKQHRPLLAELYRRAEASLRQQKKANRPKAIAPQTESDPRACSMNWQVHQIELELQNTELRQPAMGWKWRWRITRPLRFRTGGLFHHRRDWHHPPGQILRGAACGIERSRLVGADFCTTGRRAQRPAFNLFIKQVFGGQDKHSIEVELPVKGLPLQVVRVRAKRSAQRLGLSRGGGEHHELKQEEDKVRVSEIRYRRLFETGA